MDLNKVTGKHGVCHSCGKDLALEALGTDARSGRDRVHTYLYCEQCEEKDRKSGEEQERQAKLLRKQIQEIRNVLLPYFDQKYMDHWVEHFAFCSAKKEVWEILRQGNVIHCGIASFYKKVKEQGMELYLQDLASISAMENILNVLDVSDPYLEDLARRAVDLAGVEHRDLVLSRQINKKEEMT